ncbi:MAG: cysteine--tRNA ligase [Planctomycetota bacterium]|nr:cysteine--tRNA ligase [Planctomycetota bacterium]
MPIRVYNTLTRTKEDFQTISPGKVGIYLCGPTVYKEAHIGHMVGPVIFDTIKRYLAYNRFEVTWVVNITDVDDKLIAQSRVRGIPMSQVATEMTMDYCANLMALGVDQITHMPKATEHIDDIITFIRNLIERDYAYESEGDVFFAVGKDSEYGKLSNRRPEEQAGMGGDAASKKRAPGDFALWKEAKPNEPSWPSPWGNGRPGWHIECSAMSHKILGNSFDIHGGGLDLIFPHHENEVAQSECCHNLPMARYWMHNGLLRSGEAGKVGGRATPEANSQSDIEPTTQKMSRSEGAGGLRGLIERLGGERIRFYLLRTHYRSTIVFSEERVAEASGALEKFYLFFERYQRVTKQSFYHTSDQISDMAPRFRDHQQSYTGNSSLLTEVDRLRDDFLRKMDDDFNTGAAMSDLFQLLTALNRFADESNLEDEQTTDTALDDFRIGVETLRELAYLLGLFIKPPVRASDEPDGDLADSLVRLLINLRNEARQNKNFDTADQIRDSLTDMGIILEDAQGTTRWRSE